MGFLPPPGGTNQHAAGMANASHAAHAHNRLHDAENLAELKAMRRSRFGILGRLLNRLSSRSR
ncbi:MAG: hypothetical protein ABI047_15330 [Jatrophihabitantaceae bacterium]